MSFPKNFLWGASVAQHQVEGNNRNQWTMWEHKNARKLAETARKRIGKYESWPRVREAATDPSNYVSEGLADHYNRYEEDLDLLTGMNMNAFRFGVEWSRIEPEEGVWNEAAIEHYRRYIAAVKKRNLEPVMTLLHFTLPVWFAKKGGFEKRANVRYFVRFARKVMHELGSEITYVITINEPEVYAVMSYQTGWWPPAKRNVLKAIAVVNNQIVAHNKVAHMIHRLKQGHKVSVAKHSLQMHPATDSRMDRLAARVLQYINDGYMLSRIVKTCDFLGLNYYQSFRIHNFRFLPTKHGVNDLNWPMDPADIQSVLERWSARYKLPILITENGLADSEETYRKWWIDETVKGMEKAIGNGVELIGYLHWSLMDNFEWSYGKWPRFGLVAVNYETGERTLRESAKHFGRLIKKLRV